MKTLRVVLWDQLSQTISSLKHIDDKHDVILMCEVRAECTYVKHHQKKLVFLLSAMRHFAQELKKNGYHLEYVTLDDPNNSHSICGEINRYIDTHQPDRVVITWPSEYRILAALLDLKNTSSTEIIILEDDRFLASREEFATWAQQHKSLRMEFFYHEMRKKFDILMRAGKPEGGKWNYDAENRRYPKGKLSIPDPYIIAPDSITQTVIELVSTVFSDHFGDILPFEYAVTRKQALAVLTQFIAQRLVYFGDYQDVMIEGQPWMFHSQLSFYLNVGLLDPLECIQAAEAAYHTGAVALNAAEGFIRQILGWREFVRGIYWLKMPTYKLANYLNATNPLPGFYWNADTKMNCIKQCVTETKLNAYAHHIQRLMVLGNFALLVGVDPQAVNEWYLIVYADAHEWVELPNVTGMILFADGGYLASKPYAASGAYINKMSNYCQNCGYNVKEKNGATACPFNYLYWDFLIRHRQQLQNNPRLSMIYTTLARMDADKIKQIQTDAKHFISQLSSQY